MELSFVVNFKSPFHMGSGHGRAGLFDRTPIFDGQGILYLPGSAIKGKLRHSVHRLTATLGQDGVTAPMRFSDLCPSNTGIRFCRGEPCAFCRLFGSPVHPGDYVFEDAHVAGDPGLRSMVYDQGERFRRFVQTESRPRVSLERTRRVAKKGHLLMSENGASYLSFQARIWGHDDSDVQTLLRFGLSCLTHLGGGSAVGLGRMEVTLCTGGGGEAPSVQERPEGTGNTEKAEISL